MGERIQHGAAPTGPEPSQVEPHTSQDLKALQAENERLTKERDEFATLVCAYAAEEAPEAMAILAADRDLHFERANRAEAALAESERKRVEIIRCARNVSTYVDPVSMRRMLENLIASFPNQETTDVQG